MLAVAQRQGLVGCGLLGIALTLSATGEHIGAINQPFTLEHHIMEVLAPEQ